MTIVIVFRARALVRGRRHDRSIHQAIAWGRGRGPRAHRGRVGACYCASSTPRRIHCVARGAIHKAYVTRPLCRWMDKGSEKLHPRQTGHSIELLVSHSEMRAQCHPRSRWPTQVAAAFLSSDGVTIAREWNTCLRDVGHLESAHGFAA